MIHNNHNHKISQIMQFLSYISKCIYHNKYKIIKSFSEICIFDTNLQSIVILKECSKS